jgi:hypothetical protein
LETLQRLFGSIGQTTGEIRIMRKKIIVIALAAFAFALGSAPRSNAGTEIVEPYSAPPAYNYAPPPPRPVVFVPRPVVGVVVAPAFGFFGPRFGFYRARRFYGRPVRWRPHPYWR